MTLRIEASGGGPVDAVAAAKTVADLNGTGSAKSQSALETANRQSMGQKVMGPGHGEAVNGGHGLAAHVEADSAWAGAAPDETIQVMSRCGP